MKIFFTFTLIFGLFCNSAVAGEYAGLIPGVSTLKQANEALGDPLKVSEEGLLYSYSTKGHGLAGLSIRFDSDKRTISEIQLVFEAPYEKEQIKEWFDLNAQPDSSETIKDNLVELYSSQGIKIFHESENKNGKIIRLSHIDTNEPNALKTGAGKTEPKKDLAPDPKKAEEFARQADPYIEKDDYAGAIPYLEKAAYYAPDKVIYSSMLAYAYFQTDDPDKAISTARKVIAENEDYISYSILGTVYFQKKDYKAAIPYLEKATGFEQDKTKIDNLQFLGVCYYELGESDQALNAFVKAYKKNRNSPISVYYLGVVSDRLGNNADAKFYYKKYLGLKHNNLEMNKLARQRLTAVSKKSGKKTKRSLFKAVDMIQQELKDF